VNTQEQSRGAHSGVLVGSDSGGSYYDPTSMTTRSMQWSALLQFSSASILKDILIRLTKEFSK